MPVRPESASSRSGMALILTLAALTLVGGLLFWIQARAMSATQGAIHAETEVRLRAASAEAVRAAMLTLQEDADRDVDSLEEDWAQPQEWTTGDGIAVRTYTEDAGRFFDWNNVAATQQPDRPARTVLLDLMAACGQLDADARVDALTDYVDSDADGVYEDSFYRLADLPFSPPQRPLWAPDELFDIHDFSPEWFVPKAHSTTDDDGGISGDLLTSCVVVPAAPMASPRPVNLNTANRAVLLGVLGPERESAVRALMAYREVQPLQSAGMLAAVDSSAAAELESWVTVASSCFRIRARAALPGATSTVTAWVQRETDGSLTLLQWMEEESGA